MLYCIKISAVLFLQNYCVLLQGVYNIIVDNTGAAAPGWRNTDMTKQEMLQLKMTATRVRMGIIEATHGGKSGHPGGSLSAADVLTYLYFKEMQIDPQNPQDPDRDRFVLSKGHAAPGLSKYAPKMFSMMIPVDKIKDVIGKGGKVIQEMCANFNCKIDIEEDGHVFISAVDQDDAKRAIATIKTIVEDPEIGAIYKGRVTRLMNFGAFVEIAPGKEGLVHISKLDDHRVEHVEDVVAVGDPIFVMVTDIDQQGRINLSRKDALAAIAKKRAEAAQQ